MTHHRDNVAPCRRLGRAGRRARGVFRRSVASVALVTYLPLALATPAWAEDTRDETRPEAAQSAERIVSAPANTASDPDVLAPHGDIAAPAAATHTPANLPTPDDFAIQLTSLPGGADKSGVTSQTISVPQGAGKLQGMGESFSAQLSTGIATFNVPISLPAARGAAQPSLALSYSSSGGHGVAGVGWEIGVPFIQRQTDRGVPGYDDPQRGERWRPTQDRFVFNGGQELVPICRVASGGCADGVQLADDEQLPSSEWVEGDSWYFRPRVEGSFLRFFWSPDHKTWKVQDKSGVWMELGVDGNGEAGALETDPDDASRIFRWNLAREYDTYRDGSGKPVNVVAFRYEHDHGLAYLTDIYDTPPAANAGGAALSSYAHHTRLRYEARPDAQTSYRRGWPTSAALRLVGIDVASAKFDGGGAREMVRRYHLAYDAAWHVSLLQSVQLEGKCDGAAEGGGESIGATACPRLPAMTFDYSHVLHDAAGKGVAGDLTGYEGFDETLHKMASSPDRSVDEQLTDLFDVNADGLPDVLVTAPGLYGGKHGVYFNGGDGTADGFSAGTIGVLGVNGAGASTISLSNDNVAPLDLDADGVIDLLHMPKVKTYSVYTPKYQGGAWWWVGRSIPTASQQNPKIDLGQDAAHVRVMDVNADGLVDIVYSAGTQYQTFFSLGRLPNGDGQFGQGSWASSSTSSISNSPVAKCVPWAGTPVLLDDPEIKIGDMNGDGLPDLVRLRKGDVRYWPGRGDGSWGTGDPSTCVAGTFAQHGDVAMTTSPQYTDLVGDSLRLDDVNGDGLDDLVQIRFQDVDIWLNVDGVGWTAQRHTVHGTPASPSFAQRVRLVDTNGSGTRDILWGDGRAYKYIDLAGGTRPWVLTTVSNGLGKTTTLEYATSTELMLAAKTAGTPWTSFVPMPLHVVRRVTDSDNLSVVGRPAGQYVTEYTYANPVYDGRQREFRGFRVASAKKVGDANSPASSTDSTFLLGECLDSAGQPCAVADRWKDNPHEALKGLPVVSEVRDEAGTYLSTSHQTYTLRKLYDGLDGRGVYHAFQSETDTYLYDAASFVKNETDVSTTDVRSNVPPGDLSGHVKRRAAMGTAVSHAGTTVTKAGTAATHSSAAVDVFGNATQKREDGRIGVDTPIYSVTTPGRPAGDTTGWLWRTVESFATEADPDGSNVQEPQRRNHQITSYDAHGKPTDVRAYLVGTLPLDRSDAGAPAPVSASQDTPDGTPFTVSTQSYDPLFGNPLLSKAFPDATTAGNRCRGVDYDPAYAHLPIHERVYAGAPGDGDDIPAGCGSKVLTTAVESYDRGLGLALRIRDLHDELTTVGYDGFGRLTELHKPDPVRIGQATTTPSVLIEYRLPDVTKQPYSLIHTETQDGKTPERAEYQEAWAYVDGLGRTIATLAEADPKAGDEGDWIVNGLTDYDAKGAARRAFLAWFWSGAPDQFPLSFQPASLYGRQRYDAFGRQVETYGLDGSITLRSKYHALSQDKWDAADIGPGPHEATHASAATDGHGRTIDVVERVHAGASIEERHTLTAYLPTGEVAKITRHRGALGTQTPDPDVVRWMLYDTLGRRVLNVEPNTTKGYVAPTATPPSTMRAWRYAYNNAGDLVGTSDARGCGANYDYDLAGRLLSEDYSPCEPHHAAYTTDAEVTYHYDDLEGLDLTGTGDRFPVSSDLYAGRLAWVADRAARTVTRYDGRGRVTGVARQVARPDADDPEPPASRYADHWYVRQAAFDGADRPIAESTGAEQANLLGGSVSEMVVDAIDAGPDAGFDASGQTVDLGSSVVTTEYTARGTVANVGGSYGTLVGHVTRDADGLVGDIQYADKAHTTTSFQYDGRRRLRTVQTYRAALDQWTSSTPPDGYSRPIPAGLQGGTTQLLLQDDEFTYDEVDNPTEIRDWRIASEWPAGAKPVTRKVQYDDLYRVKRVDYETPAGTDPWTSPFAAETAELANLPSDAPPRAQPVPYTTFDNRVLWQSFEYDWLGNSTKTDDDAHGFYDRSLGTITNGAASGKPYQLQSATNASAGGTRTGSLNATYDDAGNLTSLVVARDSAHCAVAVGCQQSFHYQWDEVGRLVDAKRWDSATDTTSAPAAHLRYAYDVNDARVIKTAPDAVGVDRHTLYVFATLEIHRATFDDSAEAKDYRRDASNETPYLMAHGVRLGRVVHEEADPELALDHVAGKTHVFLELGDHLGSTSTVLDLASGELVEKGTYQAYGGAESDYRPGRWKSFREEYRFTGKEEDVEVGLVYFGARFLAPLLGRWTAPDPLSMHNAGAADLNVYSYVHGKVLRTVDLVGLSDTDVAQQYQGEKAVYSARRSELASAAEGAWNAYLGLSSAAKKAASEGMFAFASENERSAFDAYSAWHQANGALADLDRKWQSVEASYAVLLSPVPVAVSEGACVPCAQAAERQARLDRFEHDVNTMRSSVAAPIAALVYVIAVESRKGTLDAADHERLREIADTAAAGESVAMAAAGVVGLTPRAARRAVMREAGLPTSQQPQAQRSVWSKGGASGPPQPAGRQYSYTVSTPGGGSTTFSVQHSLTDDVPDHGPHWEAGEVKAGGQSDSLGRPRLTSGKSKVEE